MIIRIAVAVLFGGIVGSVSIGVLGSIGGAISVGVGAGGVEAVSLLPTV